jgi:CSLREA domain-containing protein
MRIAFASAAAAAVLLITAASASAATLTVTTTADDSGSACSLRDAIDAANNDASEGACPAGSGADTIQITASGLLTLASALPSIESGMSLIGPGQFAGLSVEGDGASFRVFEVDTNDDVLISGMEITDGSAPFGGGVDHSGAGTLTLDNVLVIGNEAESVESGTDALAEGGGINNAVESTLVIRDSTISNNAVNATATNSGNFAIGNGSAIASGGPLTIDRTTVAGNSIEISSEENTNGNGAVFSRGETTITNSAIITNSSEADTTGGGAGGNALLSGGGIFHAAFAATDTLALENVTIAANTQDATGTLPGAGVARGGGVFLAGASGSIESSTIAGNEANQDGANVHLNAPGETLTFDNTIVADKVGAAPNCSAVNGDFTSLGHNLEESNPLSNCQFLASSDLGSTDPTLDVLGPYGGPTATMALLPGSPAIEQGDNTGEGTDQRGQTRPRDLSDLPNNPFGGDGSDIGAFEVQTTQPDPAALAFGSQVLGTASSAETITVTNVTASGLTATAAALVGPDAADFTITSDNCDGAALASADTCTVGVAFSPSSTVGAKAASVTVSDDESVNPLVVLLSGTATTPPVVNPPAQGPSTSTPTAPTTTKKKCKKKKKRSASTAKKKCKKKK